MAITFNHNDQVYVKDGKLGIGTASPQQLLHLTSTGTNPYIRISSDSFTGLDIGQETSVGNGVINLRDDKDIRFLINGSDVLRVKNTGNVGIGTTSPTQKLSVSGKISSDLNNNYYGAWLDGDTSAGSDNKLGLGTWYNNAGYVTFIQSGTPHRLKIHTSNTADHVTLQEDGGNVGIGTTSPSTSLHVVKDASWEVARFEADSYPAATVYSQAAAKYAQLNIYDTRINSEPTMELRADTPHFNIRLDDTGNVLTIRDGGNVGIGTTSPSEKLDVVGNIELGDGGTGASLKYNATNRGTILVNGSEIMRLEAGGNVGIGTTSPVTDLHVNGTSLIVTQTGQTYTDGSSGLTGIGIRNTGTSAAYNAFGIETGVGSIFQVRNDGHVRVGRGGTDGRDAYLIVDGGSGGSGEAFLSLRRNSSQQFLLNTTNSETQIRNTGNLPIYTYTNDAIRMTVAAGGNVGIGTTSPAHKVDIYSNENVPLRIHRPSNANLDSSGAWGIGFSTRGDAITSTTDTRAGIFSYYNGNLFLAAANTSIVADPDAYARLTILNSGNVGIGTTSPSTRLYVDGGESTFNRGNSDGTIATFRGKNAEQAVIGTLNSWFDSNVGIGTTSPVNAGGNAKWLTLNSVSGSSYSGGIAYTINDTVKAYHYVEDGYLRHQGQSGVGHRFTVNAGTQAMLINTSGNVGIGTTSPDHKLTVYTDATSGVELVGQDGGNQNSDSSKIIFNGHAQDNGPFIQAINTSAYGIKRLGFFANRTATDYTTLPTESMSITNTGNVGIGTTSPRSRLDVYGDIYQEWSDDWNFVGQVYQTGSQYRNGIATNSASRTTQIEARSAGTDGEITFLVGTSEVARMIHGGNVGIGTTSPENKLHLLTSTTDATQQLLIQNGSTGDAAIKFNISGETYSVGIDNSDSNKFKISDGNLGTNDRIVIDSAGNVGIGITSPATDLSLGNATHTSPDDTDRILNWYASTGGDEISNSSHYITVGQNSSNTSQPKSVGLALFNSNTANNTYSPAITFGGLSTSGDYMTGAGAISTQLIANADDNNFRGGDLTFYTSGTTSATRGLNEKMRITSGGNVGIGTTSPSHLLNLNSTDSNLVALTIDNSNTDDSGAETSEIRFRHYRSYVPGQNDAGSIIVGKEQAWDQAGDRNSYMSFGTRRGSDAVVEKMRITSDGNVGIGTTSPASKLHVNGDIRINNTDRFYVGNNASYITSTSNADIAIVANRHISFASVISGVEYERVRIEEGGNVGIGTTSPSRDLHVKKSNSGGQVRMEVFNSSNTANSHGVISIYSGGASGGDPFLHWKIDEQQDWSMGIDNSDGDKLKISKNFGPGTNDYLTVDTSGNVGIGSTAPAARLNVASTGANAYSSTITKGTNMKGIINALSNNADDMVGIYFGTGTTSEGTHWSGITGSRSQSTTDWSTQLNFYTHNEDVANINDATQKMVIKGNGNVGIGTTSPGAKLDVDGNIKLSGYIVDSNSEIIDFAINDLKVQGKHINAEFGVWARSYGTVRQMGIDGGAAHMGLYTSGTEKVRIDTSGNVGIGTTAPQQALHIKGATNALMMLEGDNDNGIAGCYYKTEDTDNTMNRTKGFFGFQGNNLYGNGYFTMWLDNVNDNGTVTASEERFRWERDGDFHADGDVIAYSTTTPSDIRLKTDVETIESASEKVSKLRGVEYTWSKGKLAGQREIGLIAQEVEAVVPEVVKEKELPLWDDSGESYKTVDYEKLVALLIESNKELQARVEQLENKLDGFTK